MQDIYQILEELNISYEKHDHPAVFTVDEADKYDRGDATHSKNLFLRNKKGDKHYLVVLEASKRVDLKDLAKKIGESNLSFASPERLLKYLGLTPGSVSPLGLINDINHEVNVIVDTDLMRALKQGYHPNINTATLVMSTEDFKRFLSWTQSNITYLEL